MKFQLLIGLLLLLGSANAQKVINVRYPVPSNEVELIPGISVPAIEPGYTLWLPNGKETKGMIIIPFQRRDSLYQDNLIKYALRSKLALMYTTTDNPLEFLFSDHKSKALADDILKVCDNFKIPKNNLFFYGIALSGTRALKLTIFIMQNKAYEDLKPRAIAISDSPLDMNRFYKLLDKPIEIPLDQLTIKEQHVTKKYLVQELDGSPTTSKARYNSYSPYTKTVRNGGNAAYFTRLPLRAYVRSNVNWASDHAGGFDYDLSEFVHQLELLGSTKATIVEVEPGKNSLTAQSGIDERELVRWFSDQCQF
ncbi:hypothetical protein [Portibacter lacus]|uniref:Alpha/beta hydrolase n=1 Tax=Portibacter lacus TaxID=1099794 RepID=A0AA37SJC8_9BACT|nr:hypothetical protein [Portibacter lacus]GLR15818.1 hypothetical protein GCM10007940_04330 [Portibacter lacus]